MKEFTCKNTGNKCIINPAPYKDVVRLKQVIMNELKKTPVGIKLLNRDKSFFEKELDFTGVVDFVKNTLIGIDTSEDFNEAIFKCLSCCTYKKVYRIDEELFDNETVSEVRRDYYEILYACVEENLYPFLESLISTWKILISENKFARLLNIM